YDLVEFRRGGTRTRPLLDIRIDRRDGARVSLDDCAFVSRSLEQHLDNVDIAGSDYVLEVSSPGLERPLRTVADWRRSIGRRVHVTFSRRTDDGVVARESRDLDLVDVEGDDSNAVAAGRDAKGNLHRMRYADVIEARLVFVWNRDERAR
ncbi:MAG: ribosome maturation factor RimP, partial [Gemmatimonadaceae bacterium]